MTYANPSPRSRTAHRTVPRVVTAGMIVLVAAISVTVSQLVLGSSSSTIATPFDRLFGADSGALGRAGGELPDDVTVFDDAYPAVANLDPDLLGALRDAARDAADDGVQFYVNSGWRSAAYQEQLLDEAVDEYGSREEAARWVATSEKSAHVSGDAVDLAPKAAAWLASHGAAYGLCQTYSNEPWHFELRPEASTIGCPRQYADPTQDPRLQS